MPAIDKQQDKLVNHFLYTFTAKSTKNVFSYAIVMESTTKIVKSRYKYRTKTL